MISIIQFTYSEVKGYHGYQHVKMPLPKLIILRRKGFAYTIYQFVLTERGAFFFTKRNIKNYEFPTNNPPNLSYTESPQDHYISL